MTKFINVILVFTVILTVLASCAKEDVNEASSDINMKLSYENQDVRTDSVLYEVTDSEIYDMSIFTAIANDPVESAITYTELGSIISLEFQEEPDSYEMKEFILKTDGTTKYNSSTIKTVPIKFQNGTGSFILEENLAVRYSSNSKDYDSKSVFRGFIFVGTWDDITQSYYFIINTDPYYKDK